MALTSLRHDQGMSARARQIIYADSEAAGVVQSEIEKAGLDGDFEVQFHKYLPPGMIVTDGRAISVELLLAGYAGLRVLYLTR
jgi:hypothetical protein